MTTVLALLGSIIEIGLLKREEKEENLLRSSILPSLQKIAGNDKDVTISETASDVALMIMLREKNDKIKEKSSSSSSSFNETKIQEVSSINSLSQILTEYQNDLYDNDPPIRAYAIKKISTFLRNLKEVLLLFIIIDCY